ncbi:MAG: Two-component system sensor histidine kinase [uncultured Thermomicrobiales bacterium]|uniref:histidine kinase n=1 Tax=uncultured Thermomicrobiales bacterium TaxID=1645740 RepID=A0A6J4V1N5_9BACT|nr:MAG: Two-component system sensor histidine kinase [uncultured Thermomicrobiales bacterium]
MSLRTRLILVAVALIATYAVAAYAVVSTQRSLLIEQIDRRLGALPTDVLAGAVVPVPPPGHETVFAETEQPISEFFVGVVGADRSVVPLVSGALLPTTPDVVRAVAGTGGTPGPVTIDAAGAPGRFRAIVAPRAGTEGWVVAAQSLAETDAAIARLVRTLWIAGAVIAVVLGAAFFWIQRLGLRPIARVTATAEAITAGDRAHRVAVRDARTEAGKLGRAFNVMLDERDTSEARLRQFVADASHELRTPLTSVRGYLELYRQGAFQDKAQLDDIVRRLAAESARMHGLVEDLLALASLDERRPLRLERVDLGQVVRDAAQDARAVQPGRRISVVLPDSGPKVTGDPERLAQLVGILVSNALAHTPPGAPVTPAAAAQGAEAVVTVADQGAGLDPEAARRVFDRFWRGQAARSRAKGPGAGGAGLGLAIARSIADAHGGTISLATAPGEGCAFTVRLPRNAPPDKDDAA